MGNLPGLEKDVPRRDVEYAINEWIIGSHAERDRSILKRRLIDGVIFEDLSQEFGLSVRQIKYIVYKRENVIFKHL